MNSAIAARWIAAAALALISLPVAADSFALRSFIPDTRAHELLNEAAPALLERQARDGLDVPLVLQVGDGSGSVRNAFAISIARDRVRIEAADRSGAIYAVDWLADVLDREAGELQVGEYADAPVHPIRAVHIVSRGMRYSELARLVRRARAARFNTLILHLADGVKLASPAVRPRDDALTTGQLRELIATAEQNGLEVIPQVALLTHQEKFFGREHPELMWNRVTYDPRDERVYELVFDYLEEVIRIFEPSAIHIGHDEVAGLTRSSAERWLGAQESPLPKELFVADVKRLNSWIEQRGIATWMWGDMLLSPTDLPDMKPELLNGIDGYSSILDDIPPNIVICDWQYYHVGKRFPSLERLVAGGNPVLGATWKNKKNIRRFARFAVELEPAALGMIATTWFHVQRREFGIVNEIIDYSGERFWDPRE